MVRATALLHTTPDGYRDRRRPRRRDKERDREREREGVGDKRRKKINRLRAYILRACTGVGLMLLMD